MYHRGEDVFNGEGYACIGAEAYGKSLYLPLNFDVNLNLLKKIMSSDFPSGTVVKTLCFHCSGMGSTPGKGTMIPHAMQHG